MDIEAVLKSLTLEEKASLLSGKNVWWTRDIEAKGISSIMMSDGPHGIRKQIEENDNLGMEKAHPATCFPPAATTACSFDRDLIHRMGKQIALEAKNLGVSVVLGPGANIKRSPLCGRNFEYFSEDPVLSGEMAGSMIAGIESMKIGSSLKHFAVNNQEKYRMTISAEVDERALHEIYLESFHRALKSNPATIMASYNKIGGTYASENETLLTDILRKKWKYDGLVVSDWGACHDRVKGVRAGLDLEMPYSGTRNEKRIIEAINNKSLSVEALDACVKRVLSMVDRYKSKERITIDWKESHELARKIARESMVLLQNEDSILPLSKNASVLVVGEFAENPRIQGGGSSHIVARKIDRFLDFLDETDVEYEFAAGYDLNKNNEINLDLIEDAKLKAVGKNAVLLFIGLPDEYESEGFDRTHLLIPKSHSALIGEIHSVNPNIVVVLQCGAPIIMPWHTHCKAILHGMLGGEAANGALFDLIFGDYSPCGKLAETYPLDLDDTPSYAFFPGGNNAVFYKESLFVGYRYYDTYSKPVMYPFGFGLSYTSFKYDSLVTDKEFLTKDGIVECKVRITNIGTRKAKEIVQLYIGDRGTKIMKPKKELKHFAKIELGPMESKEVVFRLSWLDLAHYSTVLKDWTVADGAYEILIGASSKDIRLNKTIRASGRTEQDAQDSWDSHPAWKEGKFSLATDKEWETLLGRTPQPLNVERKRPFTLEATLEDIEETFVGRQMNAMVQKQIRSKFSQSPEWMMKMIERIAMEQPLESLVTMSGEAISMDRMEALLEMANGKVLRGLIRLLKTKH